MDKLVMGPGRVQHVGVGGRGRFRNRLLRLPGWQFDTNGDPHTDPRGAAATTVTSRWTSETRRRSAPRSPRRWAIWRSHSRTKIRRTSWPKLETLLTSALEIFRRVSGPGHPSTILDAPNLAEVLGAEAKYADAERVIRQAARRVEKCLGADIR